MTSVARFDFRAPGVKQPERSELFRRAVEQVAYLDGTALGAIMVSEHHGSPDGYLPSPLMVASAFAAVTTRLPITVSALLAPLYDPIRLAEDIAVLDHLAGGRVNYTLGLGYRPEEYALHGRSWSTRGADLDATIEALLAAWSPESEVHPKPLSRPHPLLFIGGGSPAAARRAARYGLHFQPQSTDPALVELYATSCRELGREPGLALVPPPGPLSVFCSRDPDLFWERYGGHLLADARGYEAWRVPGMTHVVADGSDSVEDLRASGNYLVATPDELRSRIDAGDLQLISLHPLCGGLPAEPSWESVRLIGDLLSDGGSA